MGQVYTPGVLFTLSRAVALCFLSTVRCASTVASSECTSDSSAIRPLLPTVQSSSARDGSSLGFGVFSLQLGISVSVAAESPSPFFMEGANSTILQRVSTVSLWF